MGYPNSHIPLSDDIRHKRDIGNHFEIEFCKMFGRAGYSWGRNSGLRDNGSAEPAVIYRGEGKHVDVQPDVTLWSPKFEYHDIRHKEPLRLGCWGFESKRLSFLLNFQAIVKAPVYVTFHNWKLNGSFDNLSNHPLHWVACEIRTLKNAKFWRKTSPSIENRKQSEAECCFWDESLFVPLVDIHPRISGH